MAGTILALGGALALLVAAWRLRPNQAPGRIEDPDDTPSARKIRALVDARLDEALERFQKEQEFELNEWYEKFNTLHARLAKRVSRAAKSNDQGVEREVEEPEVPLSMAYLRRHP